MKTETRAAIVAALVAGLLMLAAGRKNERDKRQAIRAERRRIWHELRQREAGAERGS